MEFHGVLYSVPKALREKRIDELLKFVDLSDRRHDVVKTFSWRDEKKIGDSQRLIASSTDTILG